MNRTGFPINETVKHTVLIHPGPAPADLVVLQDTLIRAELTLNRL